MTAQSVQFVILEHDYPFTHWDFMFEQGNQLRSWRLLSEPTLKASIQAESIPAHRKIYLDYEGPVSGNRGTVSRWDSGTCLLHSVEDETIALTLNGSKLKVEMTLERCSSESNDWQVVLSPIA